MKYHFFVCLFMLYVGCSFSQQSLLLESRIFFEDAAGNKDTIEIGYDTIANEIYNPGLGEWDLQGEFKKELEVRASHSLDWSLNPSSCILSKKIIGSAEKVIFHDDPLKTCYLGEPIIFFIKTKHQPVRITWVRNDFPDDPENCNAVSFFTPDYNYHLGNPWFWINWPNKRFACANKEHEFIVNLDPGYRDLNYPQEYTFSTIRQFQGGKVDTIYGVELIFEPDTFYSPCKLISKIVEDLQKIIELEIYPNPASELIQIKNNYISPIRAIHFYDQRGAMVRSKFGLAFAKGELKIPVEDFEPGVYLIQIGYADGSVGMQKFLKL